jgi:hypothetical protein
MHQADAPAAPGEARRPRILVALEPAILAEALAALLEQAGQDEVEVLAVGDDPRGYYDGAIVTIDLTDLDAGVVIHLPDTSGGAGIGTTTTANEEREVDLVDARSVLELLDQHCATSVPRTARFAGA